MLSPEIQRIKPVPAAAPPTRWKNPTSDHVRVVVNLPTGKAAYDFKPGETRDIPAEFNDHIHRVRCSDPACHKSGYAFCLRGHEGVVVAGVAPQLVREGVETKLAEGLDPLEEKRKEEAAALANAELGQRVINQAVAVAVDQITRPSPKPAQK